MNLFGVMEISASALGAERIRSEVAAANMANAESTRTEDGGPYKRQQVVFEARQRLQFSTAMAANGVDSGVGGVVASDVVEEDAPPIMRYEPNHPDANAQGYVAYPNINPVAEMTDLMGSVRSYEMNVAAVNASKQMIEQSIGLLS
jgi:flagellar basal-body rod protein FlgC